MNPTIKKLMKEANLTPYYDGQEKDIDKFAELIVKECAAILDTKISPSSHPYNSIGYKLKQHFGIE